MQRQRHNKAKQAVMQRRYRKQVQRDRTKYKRKAKHPKGGEA